MPPALKKLISQPLRNFNLSERWLQDQIHSDPTLLGLGEVVVLQRERAQPSGGRLDFLMQDPSTNKCYEVELMLGATDPSHIIRCIEYWDRERQLHPSLEHCAVIVAEQITARFFNVIRLLNRSVPMIAIQLTAISLGADEIGLQFTKVLDESLTFGEEQELPSEPQNLAYWETRASPDSLAVMKKFTALVKEVVPSAREIIRESNIAFASTGRQFAWLTPRKGKHCHVQISVGQEFRDTMLGNLDADGLAADARGARTVVMQLRVSDIEEHEAVLREIVELSGRLSIGSAFDTDG